eukprot:TRINITY_DN2322_c0_g2_i2.p1 TRINITY_DN2322_c0_g2~~TRINITY_DN2322_c0_g2_i2.p1  ORF type:complete len:622 (-),score=33.38 TRINITY_DN2322_c0_g2_i2:87-1952(-)
MSRYQVPKKPVRGRHPSLGNDEEEVVQELSTPTSGGPPPPQHNGMRPPSRGPNPSQRLSPQHGAKKRTGIRSNSPSIPSGSSTRSTNRVSPVEPPFARQSPDHQMRERGKSPDELMHSNRKSPVYTGSRKPGRTPSPGSHGVLNGKPPSPLPLSRYSTNTRGSSRSGAPGPVRPSYDHEPYDIRSGRNKRELDFTVTGDESEYVPGASFESSLYSHRSARTITMPSRPPASYYNPPTAYESNPSSKDKRVTPLSFTATPDHVQGELSETELDSISGTDNPGKRRHKRTASQEIEHTLLSESDRSHHHAVDTIDNSALLQNEQVRQHYAEVMARRKESIDNSSSVPDTNRALHLRSSIEQMADLERMLEGRYRDQVDRPRTVAVGQSMSSKLAHDPPEYYTKSVSATSSSGTVIPHEYRGSHTSPLPPHAQTKAIDAYSDRNLERDRAFLDHSSAFSKHDMSEVRSSLDDIAHEIKQLQSQAQGVMKSSGQGELWPRPQSHLPRDKIQRAAEPAMAMMLTSAAVDIPRSGKSDQYSYDTVTTAARSPYGSPEKNGTHRFSNSRPEGIPRLNLGKVMSPRLEGDSPISSPKLSLAALVSPHSSSAFTAPSSSRSQLSSLSETD